MKILYYGRTIYRKNFQKINIFFYIREPGFQTIVNSDCFYCGRRHDAVRSLYFYTKSGKFKKGEAIVLLEERNFLEH